MQKEAVTVMPSCSGGSNVVVADLHPSNRRLSLSYGLFKRTLFRMAEQQLFATEFCVRLGKSGSEILQIIHQAYGDDAMRLGAVFK
jgi:hypothetical protein